MHAVLIVVSLAAFSMPRATAQVATHSCSSLPLATFSYDRALPLDVRDSVAKTQDGVEIHAISFASPRGGRATGLLIVDLQRAFDLLIGRPDVDVRRLAFIGRTYGAAIGGLLAGVEHRPRTYVLIVGDGGLVTHYSARSRRAELDRLSGERRERWLAAMRPIEPIRFVGCAKGASFFFQAARKDELVTVNDAVAFQRAAPKPRVVRWYDLEHNLGWPAIIDELDWLHRSLGTAPAGPQADMWCATKERCPD